MSGSPVVRLERNMEKVRKNDKKGGDDKFE